MATRTWTLRIEGDNRGAIRVVNETERRYRKFGSNVDKTFKDRLSSISGHWRDFGSKMASTGRTIARGVSIAAVGGIAALGVGLVSAFKAADEARKIGRQTDQVIKTMGASSWTSSRQVSNFSERLAQLTGVDDEVIQSGANLILTFGNIRNAAGRGNDIFNRTVTLANDMSVALGQDMKSSSIQLGKALNDPIRGVTALMRVGVSFTQGQRDQIRTLVESGKTLEAQRLILGEVERQFGGAAKAVATPWDRLKVTLGNLQEEIGTRLFPVVEKAVNLFNNLFPKAMDFARTAAHAFMGAFREGDITSTGFVGMIERLGVTARQVWPAIQRIAGAVRDFAMRVVAFFRSNPKVAFTVLATVIGSLLVGAVVALGAALVSVISPFALVVAAVAAIAGAVVYAYTRWSWFRTAVDTVVRWFRVTAAPAMSSFIGLLVDKFQELAAWVRRIWPQVQEAITHVIDAIRTAIDVFVTVAVALWRTFGDSILGLVRATWDFIRTVISSALQFVRGYIQFILAVINGDWGKAWNAIKQMVAAIWNAIVAFIRLTLSRLGFMISAAWATIKAGASLAWEGIKSAITGVWDRIKSAVGTAADWVKDKVAGVWGSIRDTTKRVWGGVRDWLGGLWDSIKEKVRNGVNKVIDVINWFIRLINRIPGVDVDQLSYVAGSRSRRGGGGSSLRRATGGFITNGPQYLVGEGNPAHPEAVIATDPRYRARNLKLLGWAAERMGVTGFQFGGIIRAVGRTVTGAAQQVGDWVQNLSVTALGPIRSAAKTAIDNLPIFGWVKDFAKEVIDRFYNWAKGKTAEHEAAAVAGGTSGAGLGGSAAANRLLGMRLNAARGWSRFWEALDRLVMSESGWRNTAQNPTSTAYGIGQFLNSTWAGVGYRKTSDPRTQILAMLAYIAQRYGNPANAWSFKRSHNWYEQGGIVGFANGGTLPEDIYGMGRSGTGYRLHAGERVSPRGGELVVTINDNRTTVELDGRMIAEANRQWVARNNGRGSVRIR